jgi:hypothetical protein
VKPLLSLVLEREALEKKKNPKFFSPTASLVGAFSASSCSISGEGERALPFHFSPPPLYFILAFLLLVLGFLFCFCKSCLVVAPQCRRRATMVFPVHSHSSVVVQPSLSSSTLAAAPGGRLEYRSSFVKTRSTLPC